MALYATPTSTDYRAAWADLVRWGLDRDDLDDLVGRMQNGAILAAEARLRAEAAAAEDAAAAVVESAAQGPVVPVSVVPFRYRATFADSMTGLDFDSRADLVEWVADRSEVPDWVEGTSAQPRGRGDRFADRRAYALGIVTEAEATGRAAAFTWDVPALIEAWQYPVTQGDADALREYLVRHPEHAANFAAYAPTPAESVADLDAHIEAHPEHAAAFLEDAERTPEAVRAEAEATYRREAREATYPTPAEATLRPTRLGVGDQVEAYADTAERMAGVVTEATADRVVVTHDQGSTEGDPSSMAAVWSRVVGAAPVPASLAARLGDDTARALSVADVERIPAGVHLPAHRVTTSATQGLGAMLRPGAVGDDVEGTVTGATSAGLTITEADGRAYVVHPSRVIVWRLEADAAPEADPFTPAERDAYLHGVDPRAEATEAPAEDADGWGVGIETGARVEVSPASDLWMRGARYGVVRGRLGMRVRVAMDHPGILRTQTLPASWLRLVQAPTGVPLSVARDAVAAQARATREADEAEAARITEAARAAVERADAERAARVEAERVEAEAPRVVRFAVRTLGMWGPDAPEATGTVDTVWTASLSVDQAAAHLEALGVTPYAAALALATADAAGDDVSTETPDTASGLWACATRRTVRGR